MSIEDWTFKNWLGAIILGFLGLFVIGFLGYGLKLALFPMQVASKVIDADKAINNYEWYYDQYNYLLGLKQNIKVLEKSLSRGGISQDLKDKKQTELDGLQMNLNTGIGEYNSNSSKFNRNLWKPKKDVPYRIDYDTFLRENN